MTEQYPPADHQHVPDCDDYAFSGAGFHPTCERSCICRQVARVEHRVIGEAVQRVEALGWDYIHSSGELIIRAKAIDAINALREKR